MSLFTKCLRRCYTQSRFVRSTIYALSSGQGRSAIAVIRVTGPSSKFVLTDIARMNTLPEPKKLVLRKLIDPQSKEVLDIALVSWFARPNSFSGEDMCEIYVHGGTAVVASVQRCLGKLPGFRPAEPGEFTKRAFLNGKLDITQVEGLSNLLQAETEMQRRQAIRQLDGVLYKCYNDWKLCLKKCVANVEAFIDFGEDENIESDVLDNVTEELHTLQTEINSYLTDCRRGERVRSGVSVAIVGKPNVGKSTLLNIICQREIAIVSPIPGTTRDVIHSSVNIGGFPVHISDTAGIQETHDVIEQEGIKRAKQCAANSDLIIVMIDATKTDRNLLCNAAESFFVDIGIFSIIDKDKFVEILVVLNKSDLLNDKEIEELEQLNLLFQHRKVEICVMSCKTESGIDDFLKLLERKIEILCGNPLTENPILTQERHRVHLKECLQNINNYFNLITKDMVLAANELHKGLSQLGKISGKVTTEEILDVIFKDFCIGK